MKHKVLKQFFTMCLMAALTVTSISGLGVTAKAAATGEVTIQEAEIHQLLKGDLKLPTSVTGAPEATVEYSVDESKYVSVEGNTLKVIRPYAGAGNYDFTLKAKITNGTEVKTQEIPLTVAEGIGDDSYAGYLYVCFTDTKGNNVDVQQIHFYLSEDGMNWTALNGNQPAFLTGKDHIKQIVSAGEGSVNYRVKAKTDIPATTTGDASVLFPFEGKDQGVRDPYMIRGSKADGSDSNKLWILATDLNTHSANYGDASNLVKNVCGNWGMCADSRYASQSLFIWETEDLVHWTRRYIDVGSEVNADMAWAPEAIYNPEKDNYLVFWSARTDDDGSARDRLYCNETEDFVTFGPTMLYENEPFYLKYGSNGKANNSGYGNIDTSMIWVGGEDEDGNYTPYDTLYRVVKDETNNHIELQSAKTVFDPDVEWSHAIKDSKGKWVEVSKNANGKWADAKGNVMTGKVWDYVNTTKINPYTLDGEEYASLEDLEGISGNTNQIKTAEIVYNWYKDNTIGDHFEGIAQDVLQFGGTSKTTYHEGATMFKFIDRDEWCIMVDNYGNMSIRYEPYTTYDLSVANSVSKVASGYGRTGGDIGCHGGMIPITAAEYNTLINTYNADPTIDNYHEIAKISVDKRELEDVISNIKEALSKEDLTDIQKQRLQVQLLNAKALLENPDAKTSQIEVVKDRVDVALSPVEIKLSETDVKLKVGASKDISATVSPEGTAITWNSADETVAKVVDGKITAVGKGSTFVFAKAGKKGLSYVRVVVE